MRLSEKKKGWETLYTKNSVLSMLVQGDGVNLDYSGL